MIEETTSNDHGEETPRAARRFETTVPVMRSPAGRTPRARRVPGAGLRVRDLQAGTRRPKGRLIETTGGAQLQCSFALAVAGRRDQATELAVAGVDGSAGYNAPPARADPMHWLKTASCTGGAGATEVSELVGSVAKTLLALCVVGAVAAMSM